MTAEELLKCLGLSAAGELSDKRVCCVRYEPYIMVFDDRWCFIDTVWPVGVCPWQPHLIPPLFVPQYQQDYLSVGPPVYFVVRDGLNYSDESVQNRICSTVNCDRNSVGTQIAMASQQPARSVGQARDSRCGSGAGQRPVSAPYSGGSRPQSMV